MFHPEGEWTLITGASSGIGYELAKVLAAQGHNLVLAGHDEDRLYRIARELNEISDIIVMTVDLSAPGSTNELFNECERSGLKINTLIINSNLCRK
jgi:uncharacterized protein